MHPIWFIVIGLAGIAAYIIVMHFIVLGIWTLCRWIKNLLNPEPAKERRAR